MIAQDSDSDVIALSDEEDTAPPPPPEEDKAAKTWDCPSCGETNRADRTSCNDCGREKGGAAKPKLDIKAAEAAAAAALAELQRNALPLGLAVGAAAKWYSESRKALLPVHVTKIDKVQKLVIATFDENASVWKSVPFSLLGRPDCPLKLDPTGKSIKVAPAQERRPRERSRSKTPDWLQMEQNRVNQAIEEKKERERKAAEERRLEEERRLREEHQKKILMEEEKRKVQEAFEKRKKEQEMQKLIEEEKWRRQLREQREKEAAEEAVKEEAAAKEREERRQKRREEKEREEEERRKQKEGKRRQREIEEEAERQRR